MCSVASRKQVGDIIWLGYGAGTKSGKDSSWIAPRVKYGTTLVAITKNGARLLHKAMDSKLKKWAPDHIDMWLKKFVQDFEVSDGRCSYVFPPLGSFGTHQSECCPDVGIRATGWDQDYTQEGTRPSHYPAGPNKKLYAFTDGGRGEVDKAEEFSEHFFDSDEGNWKTFVQPGLEILRLETGSSTLIQRRHRREKGRLHFRVRAQNTSEVFRNQTQPAVKFAD